jgi:hypothetical protein
MNRVVKCKCNGSNQIFETSETTLSDSLIHLMATAMKCKASDIHDATIVIENRQWREEQMKPIPDLRNDHEQKHVFGDGSAVYRKGQVLQVWWTRDILGRPFDNTSPDAGNGRETWTFPAHQSVQDEFDSLVARKGYDHDGSTSKGDGNSPNG